MSGGGSGVPSLVVELPAIEGRHVATSIAGKSNQTSSRPGNIQRFEITSNKGGEKVDLSGGIVDLRYYESVLANQITATIVVIETGNDESGAAEGVLDRLPIRGGETTNFVIEDTRGEKIELEMFVNRVRDADSGTQQDMYLLDFVPEEHFNNNQQSNQEIRR